jgi:hypothetical protein
MIIRNSIQLMIEINQLTMKGQAFFLALIPPTILSLIDALVVGKVVGPRPHAGATLCFRSTSSTAGCSSTCDNCLLLNQASSNAMGLGCPNE